ncbi:hypothetical protein X773_29880 [Mesorhizobium sp. LSJC285A00]|nr:hypothetical protein X773_29880 [Mesorhizobium sp. LSJC285A00]
MNRRRADQCMRLKFIEPLMPTLVEKQIGRAHV